MKPEILVYTTFTETSRNALKYALDIALERDYSIILLHNYESPIDYAADETYGSFQAQLNIIEDKLIAEEKWVNENYPQITIQHQLTFGTNDEAVKKLMPAFNLELFVIGAPQSNGEFWGWNNEFIDILHLIPIPCLIVPKTVTYQSFAHVGFACDYAKPINQNQIMSIKKIVTSDDVQLHIIHVSVPHKKNETIRLKHKELLEKELAFCNPVYASIENSDVIATVIDYIRLHSIELLIIIPHRHDLWYSIFNQRHTKRLTRINHLPIVTLQD